MSTTATRSLEQVTAEDVDKLYASHGEELHRKIDATRDAYLGFIFPVNKSDLLAVADALEIPKKVTRQIYKSGAAFSSFRTSMGRSHVTNHIVGASILALRHKSLDTGLNSVTDTTFPNLVKAHEDTILEIAEARATWFGRIYFPSIAFSNAINVFGGKVSPDVFFDVADKLHYAAIATDRKTVRGDFGIATWLTLLGKAP